MYGRITRAAGLALVFASFIATSAFAELSADEQKRITDSAAVVTAIRHAENGIPEDLWDKASCVVVIPGMKKAAFIIGGEYGRGVMSCRTATGWSSPVFMALEKGSWGFQAGAQEIDLVLLVTNKDAATKMLSSKVSLGADASVAAGPVGRTAEASTTGKLATILSYSRSQGLFGGIDLSGGSLRADTDSNKKAYGTTKPEDVLAGNGQQLAAATTLINSLGTSPRATSGTKEPSTTDAK